MTTTSQKRPVAYLRKSRVTSNRHVSWELQQAEILREAERHGDNDLLVLSDWNRSGHQEKTKLREGYLRLLRMIEDDQVSAIYGYSLSRLSRSIKEYFFLAERCTAKRIPVHLAKEGTHDFSSASGELILNILASMAQFEARTARERAADALAVREARGDKIGQQNYGDKEGEDPTVVVETMRRVGSIIGTARELNAMGVPTRRGGPWSQVSVRQLIRREASDLLDTVAKPKAPTVGPFKLSSILTCHCGKPMYAVRLQNGSKARRENRFNYVVWRCHRGRVKNDHGKLSVPEKRVLRWLQAQLDAKGPERKTVVFEPMGEAEINTRLRELAVHLENLIRIREAGTITDEAMDALAAPYRAQIAALDAQRQGQTEVEYDFRLNVLNPDIDDADLNRRLRTMIASIQLNTEMVPVGLTWTDGTTS